jgi:hypothetical protein
VAIFFKHPRFHSKPQVPSNAKCRRYTGSAAPFVRKASPAHTAARLSLPIELAHDKGILLVGITGLVGLPMAATTPAKSHQENSRKV